MIIVGGGPAGLATAIFSASRGPAPAGPCVDAGKRALPARQVLRGRHRRARRSPARLHRRLGRRPLGARRRRVARFPDGTVIASRRADRPRRPAPRIRPRARRRSPRNAARASSREPRRRRSTSTTMARRSKRPSGTFRGRAIVGADGVGSFVRRAIGFPRGGFARRSSSSTPKRSPAIPPAICCTSTPPTEPHRLRLGFSDARRRPRARLPRHLPPEARRRHLDIRAMLAARLAERGLDIERYPIKRFAERGFDLHEPFAAPRVVLVGEAAGIDGLTGEGIAQAIAYGAFAGPLPRREAPGERPVVRRLSRGASPARRWASSSAFGARILPYFFGKNRGKVERFLVRTPDFVAVGAAFRGPAAVAREDRPLGMVGRMACGARSRVDWADDGRSDRGDDEIRLRSFLFCASLSWASLAEVHRHRPPRRHLPPPRPRRSPSHPILRSPEPKQPRRHLSLEEPRGHACRRSTRGPASARTPPQLASEAIDKSVAGALAFDAPVDAAVALDERGGADGFAPLAAFSDRRPLDGRRPRGRQGLRHGDRDVAGRVQD